MKRPRLYADTSVFGGCLDDEFAADSRKLFEEIKQGRFVLLASATTVRELVDAPKEVQEILRDIPSINLETIGPHDEIEKLRDAYIEAGVVGAGSLRDAEHVASASVANADFIVSWNFKHIVHFDKIRGYHAVNLMHGYATIPIYTPREVIEQ